MTRLTSRIALLAVAGILAATPVVAAPSSSSSASATPNDVNGGNGVDCSLIQNQSLQYCIDLRNKMKLGTYGSSNGNGPNKNNMGPPPGYKGPPSGTFNFSTQDRGYFDQRFHGYNFGDFGFFATLPFSIAIGTLLPTPYHTHLRPVPYHVYHYYPWFRGYLYFIDRRGDFVIVDPHRFRIVAVL